MFHCGQHSANVTLIYQRCERETILGHVALKMNE